MPNKILNVLFHFFLLTILYHNTYSYIVIPFNTYHPKIQATQNIAENFIKEYINNTIYIELDIGNPPQKIPSLIYSDEFGIFLLNKKCSIPSEFNNIESSSTFLKKELHKDFTYKFRTQIDMLLGSDMFKFKLNDKSQNNNHEYTCLGIGIRSEQYVGREYESNFIKQLYIKEMIENNYFSIIYDENKSDKGVFLIGIEPHLYNDDLYEEKQLRHINSRGKNFYIFWSLYPDKIFFKTNELNINITTNLVCSLEYNLGLIYGTKDYLDLIKQYFFDKLILEKKCHEEIINSAYTIFYCYNKNDIKEFPSLNLFFQQLLYTFILDYNDLFEEKDGKYFFKIIFDKNNKMQWKLGKPFLSKYTLFYDYEEKTIGFYNQDLSRKKRSKFLNVLLNIFYFIIICTFGFLGFYFGKKAYDKVRKRKIYEIDDNYEYKNDEKKNSNTILEMMIKPK